MAAGGEELSFAGVCAILEERGYRRHEIKDLTPGYVSRVVGHDRDEKGRLRFPEAPPAGRESWEAALRRRLRNNGCPEHMVAARVLELCAPDRR